MNYNTDKFYNLLHCLWCNIQVRQMLVLHCIQCNLWSMRVLYLIIYLIGPSYWSHFLEFLLTYFRIFSGLLDSESLCITASPKTELKIGQPSLHLKPILTMAHIHSNRGGILNRKTGNRIGTEAQIAGSLRFLVEKCTF